MNKKEWDKLTNTQKIERMRVWFDRIGLIFIMIFILLGAIVFLK